MNLRDRLLAAVEATQRRPGVVVLDLAQSPDLDVETLDTLAELAHTPAADGIELRLAAVRSRALELLRRSSLATRVRIDSTIDAAVGVSPDPDADRPGPR